QRSESREGSVLLRGVEDLAEDAADLRRLLLRLGVRVLRFLLEHAAELAAARLAVMLRDHREHDRREDHEQLPRLVGVEAGRLRDAVLHLVVMAAEAAAENPAARTTAA